MDSDNLLRVSSHSRECSREHPSCSSCQPHLEGAAGLEGEATAAASKCQIKSHATGCHADPSMSSLTLHKEKAVKSLDSSKMEKKNEESHRRGNVLVLFCIQQVVLELFQ